MGELAEIGTAIGIGMLIAMFLGGAVGGKLGERWHSKLEEREIAERTSYEAGRTDGAGTPVQRENETRTETRSAPTSHTEATDRDDDSDTHAGSRKA